MISDNSNNIRLKSTINFRTSFTTVLSELDLGVCYKIIAFLPFGYGLLCSCRQKTRNSVPKFPRVVRNLWPFTRSKTNRNEINFRVKKWGGIGCLVILLVGYRKVRWERNGTESWRRREAMHKKRWHRHFVWLRSLNKWHN